MISSQLQHDLHIFIEYTKTIKIIKNKNYFYIFFFLLFIYRPSPIYNIVIGFILAWYLLFALSRGTRMLMVPPVLIFFFYFFENFAYGNQVEIVYNVSCQTE